jgi:HD-GYP domain-containing protein (c-di-GMP phosphodiesterase class II)
MQGKEPVTPLTNALLMPDKKGVNKTHVEVIIAEDIPVLCVNTKTKKERLMPFKVLYGNNKNFWQQGGDWEYFIANEYFEKIKEKVIAKTGSWIFDLPVSEKKVEVKPAPASDKEEVEELEEELEELEVVKGYGNEYSAFSGMTKEKKLEWINSGRQKLNSLITQRPRDMNSVIGTLVETTKDAAVINYIILEEAIELGDDEAKEYTQGIVDSTHEMVKSSAQLMKENFLNDELMNTLVEKSNGTILQHMTRVYLNGVAFLSYYNNLVTTSSTIQRLRLSFAEKYRSFYHSLLPHLEPENIVLERAFLGGMRAIPPDLFNKWAVGFLIHDIGKASDVEYHEGEASYNREIVTEHVKYGYQSIIKKTNYPVEASLITGYHHEYYGAPDGYGYFRSYLQQYKNSNPDAKQDYCMTYELEPMLDYGALAYFPAKILEIIDVFDSLTDPKRIYRKALKPAEALKMMHEEFIEKHHKIDVILFDIFVSFILEKEKQKKAN